MGRVWTAYGIELAKALRSKGAYAGPLLLLLGALGALLARPISRDSVSDYAFVSFTTVTLLHGLGLFVTLIYCSGLVASEYTGTLRVVMVRPLHRYEFLLAKLLHGMTYALALTVITAVAAWGLAWTFGDLRDVGSGGEQAFSASQMRSAYLLGALASLPPQWAAVAFALLVSVCVRNALSAAVLTVGLWLLMDFAKYPLHLDGMLFSSYLETPWGVFEAHCDGLDAPWLAAIREGLLASLAGIGICFGAAALTFQRRNLA